MTASRRAGPLAEINVTPMADVVIVLLIIFMLVVPLMPVDPSLALPRALNDAKRGDERLVVSIARDGRVRLGGATLADAELVGRMASQLLQLSESGRLVYLKADEGLPYSRVGHILELCHEAGADQVVLMTAPRAQ